MTICSIPVKDILQYMDYTPCVSTVKSLVDIFAKYVWKNPQVDTLSPLSQAYYEHIDQKSYSRCLILLIPILGNFIAWRIHKMERLKPQEVVEDIIESIVVKVFKIVEPEEYMLLELQTILKEKNPSLEYSKDLSTLEQILKLCSHFYKGQEEICFTLLKYNQIEEARKLFRQLDGIGQKTISQKLIVDKELSFFDALAPNLSSLYLGEIIHTLIMQKEYMRALLIANKQLSSPESTILQICKSFLEDATSQKDETDSLEDSQNLSTLEQILQIALKKTKPKKDLCLILLQYHKVKEAQDLFCLLDGIDQRNLCKKLIVDKEFDHFDAVIPTLSSSYLDDVIHTLIAQKEYVRAANLTNTKLTLSSNAILKICQLLLENKEVELAIQLAQKLNTFDQSIFVETIRNAGLIFKREPLPVISALFARIFEEESNLRFAEAVRKEVLAMEDGSPEKEAIHQWVDVYQIRGLLEDLEKEINLT